MAFVINDLEPQTFFEIFRSEPSKRVDEGTAAQVALVLTPGYYQQETAQRWQHVRSCGKT